jgi:hypothetical protein
MKSIMLVRVLHLLDVLRRGLPPGSTKEARAQAEPSREEGLLKVQIFGGLETISEEFDGQHGNLKASCAKKIRMTGKNKGPVDVSDKHFSVWIVGENQK